MQDSGGGGGEIGRGGGGGGIVILTNKCFKCITHKQTNLQFYNILMNIYTIDPKAAVFKKKHPGRAHPEIN